MYPNNGDKYYLLTCATYNMLINELFNQSLPWSAVQHDDYVEITFHTDKVDYDVSFAKIEDPRGQGEAWEFEFSVAGSDYPKSHSLTGTGQSVQVFATIIDIVKNFVSTYPGAILVFSADPSHQRLYDALVKKFASSAEVTQSGNHKLYRIQT